MKIGQEVEGIYTGRQTLFINASELETALQCWPDYRTKYNLTNLYVMDHDNVLTQANYDELAGLGRLHFDPAFMVTVEVRAYPVGVTRPPCVNFMVCLDVDPRTLGIQYDWEDPPNQQLNGSDQIKLSGNLYVAAFSLGSVVMTRPEDFADDIEVIWCAT